MTTRSRVALVSVVGLVLAFVAIAASQLPAIGAGALLHPGRRREAEQDGVFCYTFFKGVGEKRR